MKRITAFLLAVYLSLPAITPAWAGLLPEEETVKEVVTPDELKGIHAQAAVLMDADSGRILYEKKGYSQMAMASTTKIMTCIIALEYGDMEDIVTVSANAARQPKVHLGMSSGQQFKLHDLLYSLMLESHNDTAVAIAEHIGGSVEGFADLMNQKAKELGALNTNFVTPNGLDADGHQTTAAELAVIARYGIQNPEFIKITNTPSYQFKEINGKGTYTAINRNGFLNQMSGAMGVKTGFTGQAGYCFVGALEQEGKTFISVVLASGWPPDKTWKWYDTKALMNYGLDHYEYQTLFEGDMDFERIPVLDGQIGYVDSYIYGNIGMLLREDEEAKIIYDYEKSLEAPVYGNQTIGSANVYVDDVLFASFPIRLSASDARIDITYCLNKILSFFLL